MIFMMRRLACIEIASSVQRCGFTTCAGVVVSWAASEGARDVEIGGVSWEGVLPASLRAV